MTQQGKGKPDSILSQELREQLLEHAKKSLEPMTLDGVTYRFEVIENIGQFQGFELRRKLFIDWETGGLEYTYQYPVVNGDWAEVSTRPGKSRKQG